MKKHTTPGLVVAAALLAALLGCKSGGGGGGAWTHLGDRKVAFAAEQDTIMVTGAAGRFTKIQLRVKKRGVQFHDLKVHFANGDVQDVELRDFIPKGGQTRVIDLPGKKRTIKKVVFVYKSKGKGKGKAIVRLWGRH